MTPKVLLSKIEQLINDHDSKWGWIYTSSNITSLKEFLVSVKNKWTNSPSFEDKDLTNLLYILANNNEIVSKNVFDALAKELEIYELLPLIKFKGICSSKTKLLTIYHSKSDLTELLIYFKNLNFSGIIDPNIYQVISNILLSKNARTELQKLQGFFYYNIGKYRLENSPLLAKKLLVYLSPAQECLKRFHLIKETTQNLNSLRNVFNAQYLDIELLKKEDLLPFHLWQYYLNLIVKINVTYGLKEKVFYNPIVQGPYSEEQIKKKLVKMLNKKVEIFSSLEPNNVTHYVQQINNLEILIKYYAAEPSLHRQLLQLKLNFIDRLLDSTNKYEILAQLSQLFDDNLRLTPQIAYEMLDQELCSSTTSNIPMWMLFNKNHIPIEFFMSSSSGTLPYGIEFLKEAKLFSCSNFFHLLKSPKNAILIAIGLRIAQTIGNEQLYIEKKISFLIKSICEELSWQRLQKKFPNDTAIFNISYIKDLLSPLEKLENEWFFSRLDNKTLRFSKEEYQAILQSVLEIIFNYPSQHKELSCIIQCGILAELNITDFINMIELFISNRNEIDLSISLLSVNSDITKDQAQQIVTDLGILVKQRKQLYEQQSIKSPSSLCFFKPYTNALKNDTFLLRNYREEDAYIDRSHNESMKIWNSLYCFPFFAKQNTLISKSTCETILENEQYTDLEIKFSSI